MTLVKLLYLLRLICKTEIINSSYLMGSLWRQNELYSECLALTSVVTAIGLLVLPTGEELLQTQDCP